MNEMRREHDQCRESLKVAVIYAGCAGFLLGFIACITINDCRADALVFDMPPDTPAPDCIEALLIGTDHLTIRGEIHGDQ